MLPTAALIVVCAAVTPTADARPAAQPVTGEVRTQADKATAALEAGRFAEAIELLEGLVKQMPGDAGLHLNLGMALTMGGQAARAVPVLQRALTLQPGMLPANLFLGLAQLDLGAPDKAVTSLERVVATDPDNAYARQALGQAYSMLDRHDKAVEQFEFLRQAQPANPQVLAALGQGYEQVARDAFASLQQLGPDAPHVWLLVADVLTVQEKYPQALDLLRKAQTALPGFPGIHESVASVYTSTGHADWAAAEMGKAKAPDCKTLPVACAVLEGRHQDALRRTAGARQAAALYWRAKAANELAAATFESLDGLPPSMERHLVRAGILRDQGQAMAAADELKQALALSPGNPEIERELAGALFAARDADQALPLLEKLAERAPDDLDVAVAYAEVLMQTQRMDTAIPLLKKAVAARPDWPQAHSALGRALMAKGEAQQALPHLEKALGSDQDGSLHYQLAQAYQRIGQTDKAKAMLEKYQAMQAAAPPEADETAAPTAITPPVP